MALKKNLMFIIAVLLLLAMEEVSGCYIGQRCSYARTASPMQIQSRKMIPILKNSLRGPVSTTNGDDEELVVRELRMAPSGPDPLHHNGNSPKKPRTP